MSTAQISAQALDGSEQGALKVKNTFFHLEQMSRTEDDSLLDDIFEFERYQSEPVLANRQFGRTAIGHTIVEAEKGLDDCCTKTVGCSATAETLDECAGEAADAIISESDHSSETERDADGFADSAELNEISNFQPDAFDLPDIPELPEEMTRQTSNWSVASGGPCRQTTDFSDHGGFELSNQPGFCRQVTEQVWPSTSDGFSWQAAGQSAFITNNGFCQQPTDNSWATMSEVPEPYIGESMTLSATMEQDVVADNCQVDQALTEAMPPCVAVVQMPMMQGMPGMPMMWPGMPGMQMMPGMPPGAWLPAGEYTPAQPMSKRRNNWRKSKSLVTMAQEAQQWKRQEQQLRMQQQLGAFRAAYLDQVRVQQQQQVWEQKQEKPAQEQDQLPKQQEVEQDTPVASASSTEKEGQQKCVPKFCEYCGKGIQLHFKFCQFCGTSTAKTFAAYKKSASESS